MAWRLAKALEGLRSQINAAYPNRKKASDGTIGDAAHASRSSDHNPWVKDGSVGVVTGMDITHDPVSGVNSQAIADSLVASKDPRIKYIISNGRIVSGSGQSQPAWKWRKYTGANKHNKHVHISVKGTKKFYDDTQPWALDTTTPVAQFVPQEPDVVIPRGGDPDVFLVQTQLKTLGYNPGGLDGLWGGNTAGAIAGFLNDIPLNPPPIKAPVSADDFKKVLPTLKTLLANASKKGFTRPIAPERAEATPNELAKKLPEVAAAQKASFWSRMQAWWQGIFGTVSGTAVVAKVMDAKETVDPVKESFFSGNTSVIVSILGVVAVVGLAVFLAKKANDAANASANAATEAFQSGERL